MMHESARRPAWESRGGAVEIPAEDASASGLVRPARGGREGPLLAALSLLFFVGLICAVWELVSLARVVPDFVLPTPLQVAQDFGLEFSSGDLLANAAVTLLEALGGFLLAAFVAAPLGYAIAHSRALEVVVAPFVAASQAVPAVAVAPIIILLLKTGLLPKVIVAAVIVAFPLLVTTVRGLRGVDRDAHDVARVFGASRLQTFLYVELPLATPTLLSGLKLGLTLSITGAVVGEFVAADSGLGFMINNAVGNFETATRYVALISLIAISVLLFSLVTLVERILLRWLDV